MIPKIIHYVWLGGCEKPKSVKQCIASWKKHCPDYVFMEWNEKNSPLTANEFVRKAYEDKMWAFVSDYIRMFAMDKYGGVYLDTDVNMLESLDSLLGNRFFTGFESEGLPFSGAVFGAEKKHELLRKMLRYYDSTTFVSNHAEKFINTRLVSQLLIDNYGCSKHAFLFLVRKIDSATLEVLKTLDDPQHDFYIHVDAKSGPIDLTTITRNLQYSRAVLIPRVSVGWAAYSMVSAEMELLRYATSAKTQYSYYHLLSESDFPLVSNQHLQAFFAKQDLEFVEIERNNDANTRNRLKYYYPLQEWLGKRHGFLWILQKGLLMVEHLIRINRLKHEQEIPIIAKGSQWFSITDKFAKYVVSNSALVTRICRASRAPDEVFLQTLLLNSGFSEKVAKKANGNLRYIRWGQGNSPQTLGPDDFRILKQSGKLFARKINKQSDGLDLRQMVIDSMNKE